MKTKLYLARALTIGLLAILTASAQLPPPSPPSDERARTGRKEPAAGEQCLQTKFWFRYHETKRAGQPVFQLVMDLLNYDRCAVGMSGVVGEFYLMSTYSDGHFRVSTNWRSVRRDTLVQLCQALNCLSWEAEWEWW